MVATLFVLFPLLFPLNPRNHQKSPFYRRLGRFLSIDDSCKFIDDSCTKHWRFMYLLTKAEIVNKFMEKCLGRISCSVTFVENKKTNYDENNHHIQPDDCLPELESFCKKCGGIFGSSEYYATNQPTNQPTYTSIIFWIWFHQMGRYAGRVRRLRCVLPFHILFPACFPFSSFFHPLLCHSDDRREEESREHKERKTPRR